MVSARSGCECLGALPLGKCQSSQFTQACCVKIQKKISGQKWGLTLHLTTNIQDADSPKFKGAGGNVAIEAGRDAIGLREDLAWSRKQFTTPFLKLDADFGSIRNPMVSITINHRVYFPRFRLLCRRWFEPANVLMRTGFLESTNSPHCGPRWRGVRPD